jgi:hypothetical protein
MNCFKNLQASATLTTSALNQGPESGAASLGRENNLTGLHAARCALPQYFSEELRTYNRGSLEHTMKP